MPAPNILLISTDQEIVVEEEITPCLIHQDSVGLESILDNRTCFAVFGLDFGRLTEEIQAHHHFPEKPIPLRRLRATISM